MSAEVASASPTELVALALAGERVAWETIVHRYQRVAWKVVGTFDLATEDRNDVFAATFFRLFERLATIREPDKLPGWIATTARNEALTLLRARNRERPANRNDEAAADPPSDERLLESELNEALRLAFAQLGEECREFLSLLTADPPLSYDDIAVLTGRPRGSIGPTRQRCLDRLRRSAELRPFFDDGAP
ncbi:MAG: sigma-70 family RNA polymerase sigma factor [Aquihabitans sp.]